MQSGPTALEQVLLTLVAYGTTGLFVLLTVLAFRGREQRDWPRTVLGVAALCAAATFGVLAIVQTLMYVGPGPPDPTPMPWWLMKASTHVVSWFGLVTKVLAIAGGLGIIVRCAAQPKARG